MISALWLHKRPDPIGSGELRRLGLPALAIRRADLTSNFAPAAGAAQWSGSDVVVMPLDAVDSIPSLRDGFKARILVEIDWEAASSQPGGAAMLSALASRLSGVVARGPRAGAWAERALNGRCPVWIIPDPAVRQVELAAAALAANLPLVSGDPFEADVSELWFAEPGDHVTAEEVAALLEAWSTEQPGRLVVAPPLVGTWLRQAGLKASFADWSLSTLKSALGKADSCCFVGPEGYSQARRRVVALRTGAPAHPPTSVSPAIFEPSRVAAAWEDVISAVSAERPPTPQTPGWSPARVLVLIDLIQDLDPVLPLLDALASRRDVVVQVVVTSWVQKRSPRVARELEARGLPVLIQDRDVIIGGSGPVVRGVDAVVTVAESSHSAHAPSHALVRRAQAAGIPTFALQHGVENVGLHAVEGEADAVIASDHMFVWFPADRTPASVPEALRPRLVHVGRACPPEQDLTRLTASFATFDSIVAVFENLHWKRYDQAWRTRFLNDCAEFALMDPSRAVVLKPHHAGMWSVINRHLIPQWPSNLIIADPTEAFWEPFTAGVLVQMADAVITTPSTVAIDAVQAGKPVAIGAYGLELPAYSPLPLLQHANDWSAFVAQAGSIEDARRRARFLSRTVLGGDAGERAAQFVVSAANARRAASGSQAVNRAGL